jgi:hypothetical protein
MTAGKSKMGFSWSTFWLIEHTLTHVMFTFPLSSALPGYCAGVCFSVDVPHILNAFSELFLLKKHYTILEQMRPFLNFHSWVCM